MSSREWILLVVCLVGVLGIGSLLFALTHRRRRLNEIRVSLTDSISMEFVPIPGDGILPQSFWMGSRERREEAPIHEVTITESFYAATTVVTQAQMECWTHGDGKKAFLPTEAQWEWMDRSGTETEYWIGDGAAALDEVAWFDGNARQRTWPVGQKKANLWGLFDVHGLVYEWTESTWHDHGYRLDEPTAEATSRRVVRGGSWVGFAS